MSGTSNFAPFTSGCGKCYSSTDYYKVNQNGGVGNYSDDGLIPQSNGKNMYKVTDFNVPMDKLVKDNYGIEYATAFGGKKKKVSSSKKSKKTLKKKASSSKKSMKGGMESSGATPMDQRFYNADLKYDSYPSDSGNGVMSAYGPIEVGNVGTGMLAPFTASTSSSANPNTMMKTGGKKKSTKKIIKSKSSKVMKKKSKKSMKGGNDLVHSEQHDVQGNDMNTKMLAPYDMKGGKSKKVTVKKSSKKVSGKKTVKKSKSMKGGNDLVHSEQHDVQGNDMNTKMLAPYDMKGGKSKKVTVKKSSKKVSGKKTVKKSKSMKGGNDLVHSEQHDVQGNDMNTKMLAPYDMKGGKSKKVTVKKSSKKVSGKKTVKKSKSMKGGNDLVHSEQHDVQGNDMNTKMLAPYDMKGGKSKKVTVKKSSKKVSGKKTVKKSKSMKGGMESSGATPMDQRFYNADLKYDNYPSDSGNGVMSAYGPIEVGNVGTGMLAPFNASTSSTANPNTMMKTGGKKKTTKKSASKKSKKLIKKGGDGIPYISDSGVTRVQNALDDAVSGFSNFMQELDRDYLNSVNHLKGMKIGNQRLIKGGKKKVKKVDKKSKKTKKSKKLRGGFDGSDWSTTLASRGPANAPDSYWGVDGEKWFRQFNKTGEYIPNSQLPYAATPELAGNNESNVVTGYDERIINNGVSNNF